MADKTEETAVITAGEDDSLFSGLDQDLVNSLHPAKVRMILMYLTGQYTQKKIAQIVGVANQTVSGWLVEPAVQTVIKELQQREFAVIDSKLKAMRHKAIETMDELLQSDMDNVRYQAAKDILDRGGHKAQSSIKVEKTVTTVEQQLASLAEFTIDDAEIIDISDVVEEVKNG